MAAATDLPNAAVTAADNLHTLWLAGTLKAKLIVFWVALLPLFPQSEQNNHPVSNWLTLIAALADQMPNSNVTYSDLDTAINYVYRLCWLANQLDTQALITTAQATAILTEYNADF
jgi:hypothetical protein